MQRIKAAATNSELYQDQLEYLAKRKRETPRFSRAQWLRDAVDEKMERETE